MKNKPDIIISLFGIISYTPEGHKIMMKFLKKNKHRIIIIDLKVKK